MASILANTGLSVAGRAGGVLLGLAITALLGRILGVEHFGQYALILSFGAILHVITDGGFYLTLTKEIAQRPEKETLLLSAITGLRAVLFAVVFGLGAITLLYLPSYSKLAPLFVVAGFGFLFQSFSQLLMGVFQAHSTVWKAFFGDITGRFVQFALILALFFSAALSAYQQLLIATIAFSVSAVVAYGIHIVATPARPKVSLTISPGTWKKVVQRSWPLGAMLMINAIYFRADMIMLAWFREAIEVGWYGLAYRVVESGLFLPAAFGGLLLPKLSTATHKKVSQLIGQSLFVMALVGGLCFVLLAGASEEIIVFFVGSAFAPAGIVLTILTAALVTMFFGNVFGFSLVALGQQRALLYLYLALALGNIIANLFAIPRYGPVGAAWTTVITEALSMVCAATLVARIVPFHLPVRQCAAIVSAALAAALMLHMTLSIWHVMVAVLITTVTYLAVAFMLGLIRRDHVAYLLQP